MVNENSIKRAAAASKSQKAHNVFDPIFGREPSKIHLAKAFLSNCLVSMFSQALYPM
jgi:hypothetical protein